MVVGIAAGGFYAWGFLGHRSDQHHQIYQHAVHEIDVATGSTDITLTSGTAGQVTVDRELDWTYARPNVVETWDGDVLRIATTCPSGWDATGCAAHYTIAVPSGVAVDGQVTSGNIAVHGITGGVRLTVDSGDFSTDAVEGDLWLRTTSGRITASGLRSSDVDVASTSGDVALDFAADPTTVRADVHSGNLDITVPRSAAYDVQASVRSGAPTVDVTQDRGATRLISAQTSSGDLRIQYSN